MFCCAVTFGITIGLRRPNDKMFKIRLQITMFHANIILGLGIIAQLVRVPR